MYCDYNAATQFIETFKIAWHIFYACFYWKKSLKKDENQKFIHNRNGKYDTHMQSNVLLGKVAPSRRSQHVNLIRSLHN